MDNSRGGHVSYKFHEVNLDSLHKMVERSPTEKLEVFKRDYGKIVEYLKAPLNKYQHNALHTLLQFYNPPLRCFTFLDYQLAPTLEEYSCIMGIPIKLQVLFHVYVEVLDYEQTLGALANEDNWKVFNVVLACSIYGIVLFPNMVDFIDMNVICIFMMEDVYHYIHSRNHKRRGGLVWCCAPLLYHWFRSHLPCKGAFMDNKETLELSKRLMRLTSKDFRWYNLRLDTMEKSEVIVSCGDFTNVPLMGIRGGINYNYVLS
ncbi:uncharacterized protein LOC127122915 [Lathyrus oleraceus]|uniref:uncharacterized protein LOC127122915 n=1 Tax=Pisum sativum TaxID=3888 RepID=UPI0021D2898C|nr:uncharacterized protein LOC127122915 [Pisum sativum]